MIAPPSDRYLSTPEAVAYLETLGVQTSRRMLDSLRADGTLPYIKARGRVRILYRTTDLAAAYLEDAKECPSNCSGESPAEIIGSAGQSPDAIFMKARALTKGASRRPGRTGAKPKSSNVTPLVKRQR